MAALIVCGRAIASRRLLLFGPATTEEELRGDAGEPMTRLGLRGSSGLMSGS
jgi:hypothetical protein